MKHLLSISVFTLFSVLLFAQTDAERKAIKSFCGCFDVSFEYTETFPRVPGYQLAKPYKTGAVEYVVLEEESPKKLVLQHLLVISDSVIIKHWRQDWEFEPEHEFAFRGNKTWEVNPSDKQTIQGKWSQEVYEVDDTPRYSGSATWNFDDGKRLWENATDAPLPRREYTTRSDYQILHRTNRLYIEDSGWIHEQDNEKVVLDGDARNVIVEEKGRNVYTKTDPKHCATAAAYWEKQKAYWAVVRDVWNERLSKKNTFTVQHKVNDLSRSDALEALIDQSFASEHERRKAIENVLDTFYAVVR